MAQHTLPRKKNLIFFCPAEDEHVLLPLCNFEVVSMRRELAVEPVKGGDGGLIHRGAVFTVNVLEVRLSFNLRASALEDLRRSRKACVETICRGLANDSQSTFAGNEMALMKNFFEELVADVQNADVDEFNDVFVFRDHITQLFTRWRTLMQKKARVIESFVESLSSSEDSEVVERKKSALRTAISIRRLLGRGEACSQSVEETAAADQPNLRSKYAQQRLAVDGAGNVIHIVASSSKNNSLQVNLFSLDGHPSDSGYELHTFSTKPFSAKALLCNDVARDHESGLIFVADGNAVLVFDENGEYVRSIGNEGQLHEIRALVLDSAGNLIVADKQSRLQV